jgi:hypothetical protein
LTCQASGAAVPGTCLSFCCLDRSRRWRSNLQRRWLHGRRLLDSSPALERLHFFHRQIDVRLALGSGSCNSLVGGLRQCFVSSIVCCGTSIVAVVFRISLPIISIRITFSSVMSEVVSGKVQFVASVTALAWISVGVSVGIQVYTLSIIFITPHFL